MIKSISISTRPSSSHYRDNAATIANGHVAMAKAFNQSIRAIMTPSAADARDRREAIVFLHGSGANEIGESVRVVGPRRTEVTRCRTHLARRLRPRSGASFCHRQRLPHASSPRRTQLHRQYARPNRVQTRHDPHANTRQSMPAPCRGTLSTSRASGPGRDDGYPSPPGQIRTCSTTAPNVIELIWHRDVSHL